MNMRRLPAAALTRCAQPLLQGPGRPQARLQRRRGMAAALTGKQEPGGAAGKVIHMLRTHSFSDSGLISHLGLGIFSDCGFALTGPFLAESHNLTGA